MTTTATNKLEREWARFRAGAITNWEFFENTKWYRVAEIARVTRIDESVIRTRRRDLRKMNAR